MRIGMSEVEDFSRLYTWTSWGFGGMIMFDDVCMSACLSVYLFFFFLYLYASMLSVCGDTNHL